MSFLSSASIVLSDENVTNMYSFVCTSALACTANCKPEGQIKAKASCVKNRQHAPQEFLYEVAALDSQF